MHTLRHSPRSRFVRNSDPVSNDDGYWSRRRERAPRPCLGEEQVAWICDLSDLLLL